MSRKEFKYIFIVFSVYLAACLETDIYLPAFPDMIDYFGVGKEEIQRLLTWNFVAISLAGPFYGPISDAVGRTKPLLTALFLFFAGSLVTVYAESFDLMLLGRVLQGIGSGGCMSMGTAILFDTFTGRRAIKAVNYFNILVPFIITMAPMLGAHLNAAFGFRSTFIAIVASVIVGVLSTGLFFNESHPAEKRTPLESKKVIGDFRYAFTDLCFWRVVVIVGLIFGGYLSFLAATAVIFPMELGISSRAYAAIQASILLSWLLASLSCGRAVSSIGEEGAKRIAFIFTGIAASLLAFFAYFTPDNPYLLTLPMILYSFGAKWIHGIYLPEGMARLSQMTGIAASLLTSTRLLICAGTVGLTGLLYNGTIYPMVAVVFFTMLGVLYMTYSYERSKATQVADPVQNHS